MKVGFVGLGTMGSSMAYNCLQGGNEMVELLGCATGLLNPHRRIDEQSRNVAKVQPEEVGSG